MRIDDKILTQDIFYINKTYHFGNQIIALSNAIFYCEVVGCNTIILNQKNLN